MDECNSATGIVGELAHIEQILWQLLILGGGLDALMLLTAMLFILRTVEDLKKKTKEKPLEIPNLIADGEE